MFLKKKLCIEFALNKDAYPAILRVLDAFKRPKTKTPLTSVIQLYRWGVDPTLENTHPLVELSAEKKATFTRNPGSD